MIKSMTGYGKGISEAYGQKLTIELKSVNHRFLDLNIKLPKGFNFAEDMIRKAINAKLVRGHVDAYVNYEDLRADKTEIEADYNVVKRYYDISKDIVKLTNCIDNMGVCELMRMPDAIVNQPNEQDEEQLAELVATACGNALSKLDEMRTKEGQLLLEDITLKVDDIVKTVAIISNFAPSMIAEHRAKLVERIQEYLQEVEIDQSKLANEVAFYSDKICIDEEITRLNSHTEHFAHIIAGGGAIGKQLDFIVQEMNRESNTIGSKCSNIEVTNCVLQLKGTIEKIREQIQNIE